MGRETGRRRKKSYWFESQSWHCLIAWLQVNGRSLIKNVILIAELSYLLKKRGLYQQQECSYHLERLELAYEVPFFLKNLKSVSVFTILLVRYRTANSRNWDVTQDFAGLGNILFPRPKFLLSKLISDSALLNSQPIQCVTGSYVNPTHLAS